jgi:hypothetical protein
MRLAKWSVNYANLHAKHASDLHIDGSVGVHDRSDDQVRLP